MITDQDRMFVSTWWGSRFHDPQMFELDTNGNTVNDFSPTGNNYFHRNIAISPSDTLWVATNKNGPGDSLIRQFDLSGNEISSFSIPYSIYLRGLESDNAGNLFTLDEATGTLYKYDQNGNILVSTPLVDSSRDTWSFTRDSAGNILLGLTTYPPPLPPSGVPEPSTFALLSIGIVGLIGYRWKVID